MNIQSFKGTMIAGILVLVPIVFIGYLGFQVYVVAEQVLAPIVDVIPIQGFLGLILLNLLALFLVALLCFLAGLAVKISLLSVYFERLDSTMSTRVPGYSMVKGIVGGVVQDEDIIETYKPVLVRVPGHLELGFEVERTADGDVVVFIPNAPNPQSGTVGVFPASAVLETQIPRLRAYEMLQFHGLGLADHAVGAMSDTGGPTSDATAEP